MIPYGRQLIDVDDLKAVEEALRSDWLTTGPRIEEFEQAVAGFVGVREGVAVSSGTAALHSAMYALGIGPGDEVIVPAMTFAATANCAVYQGGTPVFVDVDPGTLLIDPAEVGAKITNRTRAVMAVDYAGQPCDYDALRSLTGEKGLKLISDGCHALGGEYRGRKVGSLADMTVFSFHPVKHITTGEGGMIVTDDPDWANRMRVFRNHGITTDHSQREEQGTWFYEMADLGYNYRLTDLQCALGLSQLKKLPAWVRRRREIAAYYDQALAEIPGVEPLKVNENVFHVYHLYVIRLDLKSLGTTRKEVFMSLRAKGIGVNVHYIPVHLHPFYRRRFSTGSGLCPVAEDAYERILSLPIFPGLTDDEAKKVVGVLEETLGAR